MKIQEVLESKKKQLPMIQPDDFDDTDEIPDDPDLDKIPHIVMQLRSALDVDGDRKIHFKDGSKIKLSPDTIKSFLLKYLELRPNEREKMQNMASKSEDGFIEALTTNYFTRQDKSIYRYK